VSGGHKQCEGGVSVSMRVGAGVSVLVREELRLEEVLIGRLEKF